MPVLEVILAVAIVVVVVSGLLIVLLLDRSGSRGRWSPVVWWWSLVGVGLIGVAIAWVTSAIF